MYRVKRFREIHKATVDNPSLSRFSLSIDFWMISDRQTVNMREKARIGVDAKQVMLKSRKVKPRIIER